MILIGANRLKRFKFQETHKIYSLNTSQEQIIYKMHIFSLSGSYCVCSSKPQFSGIRVLSYCQQGLKIERSITVSTMLQRITHAPSVAQKLST